MMATIGWDAENGLLIRAAPSAPTLIFSLQELIRSQYSPWGRLVRNKPHHQGSPMTKNPLSPRENDTDLLVAVKFTTGVPTTWFLNLAIAAIAGHLGMKGT